MYTMTVEKLTEVYPKLERLFRLHYAEYSARLKSQGVEVSSYNPRLDEYFKASDGGWLLTFVLWSDGEPCGYSNIYVTNDMHNRDKIASEDTLFVEKYHRNGIGRKFTKFGIEELRKRGVTRLLVSAVTDTRVAPLWARMGFKELAKQMVYTF